MSKTATFTKTAVGEWVKLFPRQVTETHTSSVTFMKQLTTIAFGTILHTKNLFPADSFLVEKFCGMEVMSLKKTCGNEVAQFISDALVQAFDAFDKKYLDQLVICFYEGECRAENVLEYYVFQYSYNKEGAAVALNLRRGAPGQGAPPAIFSFDHVRLKTEKMIQTCVLLVTQFGRKLPDNYDVSLRLYYNQNAPEGYQAPGYEDGEHEEDHFSSTLEEAIHVGSVATPFHELSTHLYIKEDSINSREAIPTQNPPRLSQMERESFDGCSGRAAVSDMMDSCMSTSLDAHIQCPCLVDTFDKEVDDAIVICQYCHRRQHSLCYGLRRGDLAGRSAPHCCADCGEAPGRVPTDQRLANLDPHRRQFLCVFRRALEYCTRNGHVSTQQLSEALHAPAACVARCIKLLQAYGALSPAPGTAPTHDDTTPHPIIDDQLNKVISRFFYNNNQNIVDRLIAETVPQNTPHNPVEEVLTPTEKVDLQNDTLVGQIVNPGQASNVDDTLKEYRDAIIMLNMKETSDLPPLSGDHNVISVESLRKRTGKRRLDIGKGNGMGTKKRKSNESSCRKLL